MCFVPWKLLVNRGAKSCTDGVTYYGKVSTSHGCDHAWHLQKLMVALPQLHNERRVSASMECQLDICYREIC